MKTRIGYVAIALVALASFALPHAAKAQEVPSLPYWGPLLSCVGNYLPAASSSQSSTSSQPTSSAVTAENPVPAGMSRCTSFCDFMSTGQRIIYFALTILMFIITPALVVVGGIMMIFAGADPGLYSKGIGMIKGAVIGLAIALGAHVIVNTMLWLVGNGNNAVKVQWPIVECSVPPPAGE